MPENPYKYYGFNTVVVPTIRGNSKNGGDTMELQRVKSAFAEILSEWETPKLKTLERDPTIVQLTKTLVLKVEAQRNPAQWPVLEYTDDFRPYHPEDRWQWGWLLLEAAIIDEDLATILCVLRGNGCELVKDNTYGYVIRPIIGGHGWDSLEQYNKTKEPLNDYVDKLLPLLRRLREEDRKGRVVPNRDLKQGRLREYAR